MREKECCTYGFYIDRKTVPHSRGSLDCYSNYSDNLYPFDSAGCRWPRLQGKYQGSGTENHP